MNQSIYSDFLRKVHYIYIPVVMFANIMMNFDKEFLFLLILFFKSSIKRQCTVVSKPAFVYCVFSTIFGFEPSPTVLCDRDPDFIIQSVVGLYLD